MKIAIIGYGKMGHIIEETALKRGHEIVVKIDVGDVFDLKKADVAIEFTTPTTAEANIRAAWAQGVPVVCGTTGWNALQPEPAPGMKGKEENGKWVVRNAEGKIMLVWSSNYSIGVSIFFAINRLLAKKMSCQPQYTPSITETHHIHKLDKPSGTAKTLRDDILNMITSFNGNTTIPIESIREGEVSGTHEVKWDSDEDTIVITHIAKGRRGFALGAVIAAEEICNIY